MRFNNVHCVCCDSVFNEDSDVVVCPECGSPHHRECWFTTGKCTNNEKHSEGFTWEFPEALKPEVPVYKKETKEIPVYTLKNGEKVIVCPHCESLNYSNDAFCIKCHKLLKHDSGADNIEPENRTAATENALPENNIYNAPPFNQSYGFNEVNGSVLNNEEAYYFYRKLGGLRPDTLIDGIPAIEMAEYIGEKKSGRFIRKFANMERYGKKISASICAFLFGPIWFFYRKLYKEGLCFFFASLVLVLSVSYCSLTTPAIDAYKQMGPVYINLLRQEITFDEYDTQIEEILNQYDEEDFSETDRIKTVVGNILSYVNIALLVGMAFSADHLYKRKMKKDILKARKECSDMNSYLRNLRKKGSVSVVSAIGAAFIMLAIMIIGELPAIIIMFGSLG